MTDEYILQKVLDGNTHIFSVIVDRYKDKVFGMVYRFTGDYSEAQDLSQEVFIRLFKNLHLFDKRSEFSTWVYRISYNLCIDWSRKNKKRLKQVFSRDDNSLELTTGEMDVEETCIERQKRITLRNSINNLKEKYRTVLILFHFQGLSYEEIGDILKIPVKTVETRLYRGRNILKKILSKHYAGGELYEMQADS